MLTSPLRYPGGKAKLFGLFANLIRENGLLGCTYCEPYGGGAGLALQLLETRFVSRIQINDVDRGIVAFWRSVLSDTDRFCELIMSVPLSIDEWRRQHALWKGEGEGDQFAFGFATFYLNRTNRSGIIEGAGPIGGYSQAGVWKLDARFNRERLVSNIRILASNADKIEIENLDAVDFFRQSACADNVLIYLDPPYYVKGSKLYKNFYKHDDHVAISSLMKRFRGTNWVVTYDNVPDIIGLYDSFSPVFYTLQYSAGRSGKGSEVMFVSDTLRMPSGSSASLSGISSEQVA